MERVITEPSDLVGRWLIVDGEPTRYEDADFATEKEVRKAKHSSSTAALVIAEGDEFRIGDRLTLAAGDELDEAFRYDVRRVWRSILHFTSISVAFTVLSLLEVRFGEGQPWWVGGVQRAAIAVAISYAVVGLIHWLTRDVDGRVTRFMAGWRMRGEFDAQRAELRATDS